VCGYRPIHACRFWLPILWTRPDPSHMLASVPILDLYAAFDKLIMLFCWMAYLYGLEFMVLQLTGSNPIFQMGYSTVFTGYLWTSRKLLWRRPTIRLSNWTSSFHAAYYFSQFTLFPHFQSPFVRWWYPNIHFLPSYSNFTENISRLQAALGSIVDLMTVHTFCVLIARDWISLASVKI